MDISKLSRDPTVVAALRGGRDLLDSLRIDVVVVEITDRPVALRPQILRLFIVAGVFLGACGGLWAETIELKGGNVYRDAVVLERGEAKWRVRTKFGVIQIPVNAIERVDGKLLNEPEEPAAPVVEEAVDLPEGEAAPEEVMMEAPEAVEHEEEQMEAEEVEEVVTVVASAAVRPPLPEYRRDPRFDVLLAAVGGAFLLWMSLLVWVQKDLVERGRHPSMWNTGVALLPGAGFLIYLVARLFQRPGADAGQNRLILEKQGLFTQDAKATRSINLQFLDDERSSFGGRLEEGTGIEAARVILEEAIVSRASDIHIEPQEAGYQVRFRVDGVLTERMGYPRSEGVRIVSALKTLAQIDVAEKRKAQDGRFRVRTDVREVDFRVATANSIFGEKLVIRILDRKGGLFDLSDVGMAPEMMERFHRAIHSRAGMIIVTGPTGSGKTSTLYAALSKLDAKKLNIMTIEDPAEYELPGATQIPVNVKAGVTYEAGLRSILRQDPDVIFVGEMRDAEAAKIAIRAALTGHLVFTTLHTKDALSTVIRLEEMGVDRSQLSSGLLMLVAQRLVRVLCPHCRESYKARGDELAEIDVQLPEGATLYKASGCDQCGGMGYMGRTAIFELVVLDDVVRLAITQGAGHDELLQLARERGFSSYREDGAAKVVDGITSVEEVLEAT